MELFTNNYTSHDIVGVIVFASIMITVAAAVSITTVYIYRVTPTVPVDQVVGNLPSGPHSELAFNHSNHSDIELEIIVNSVLEPAYPVEYFLLSLLALLLLIYIIYRYWYKTEDMVNPVNVCRV